MTYPSHAYITAILALSLAAAAGCGGGSEDDGGSGGGDVGSGGKASGGSASNGGSSTGGQGSGGEPSSSGGSDVGSGGGGSDGPPILPVVPEVEDKCAGATENCVWVTGHYGATEVDFDCSAYTLLAGPAWGCVDDETNWNVSHMLTEGSFEFDLDPSVNKEVTNFWLGDEERLTEKSATFAGTHCKVSWIDGSLSGTCYGAWGENGDGSYDSEVSTSFRF